MSETAQTLIKAALRSIGVIATGETPTADELNDGLEALKFMLRRWSANKLRLYYTKQDTVALAAGTASYTIGSGGTCDTVRPVQIRGGFVRDSSGVDHEVVIIDEAKYRRLGLKTVTATANYLWYSPEYPLGKIYVYPTGSGTLYLDSLKPLTDPAAITTSIAFPPEYDEAIKYGLAVRMAPEYGKDPSSVVVALANNALNDVENLNFSMQINSFRPEIIKLATHYNIDAGD
jgi:hypothetical protein